FFRNSDPSPGICDTSLRLRQASPALSGNTLRHARRARPGLAADGFVLPQGVCVARRLEDFFEISSLHKFLKSLVTEPGGTFNNTDAALLREYPGDDDKLRQEQQVANPSKVVREALVRNSEKSPGARGHDDR